MNVLILTPFYPPMVSGAGAYTADAAVGLTQRGHQVTVLTGGGVPGVAHQDGVEVETLSSRFRGATSLHMVGRALARHRQCPFDLIVSGVAYPMGVVAAIVARAVNRPMVVLAFGEDVSVGASSRAAKACLPHIFAAANHVVTISSFSRREVVRFGGSADQCSVAPPGIDTAPFVATGEADRQRFRTRFALTDRRVILTVARLEDRKGHDIVLAAMASLVADYDDLHYLIVGDGDTRRLRDMAASLGVADRLTIVPFLETADLPNAYAAADLFAMASRADGQRQVEGFGIVYLEAAATGLACVAGVLGGCPDAVEDGVTGLCVDPTSTPAVAGALRSLLASPDLAAHMGAEGQRRVVAGYQRSSLQATVAGLLADAA